MSKGVDQYRFGTKNNWRRRMWNEVARRVPDRRNARVLYLAGPQNADVMVATSKGFDARNMIAVEMDAARVRELRSIGVNCIPADLTDVCFSWPDAHAVDVVVADFCGGLSAPQASMLNAMQRHPFCNAVLMMNLQRGRDAWSNAIRDGMKKGGNPHIAKHRGRLTIVWWLLQHIPVEWEDLGEHSDWIEWWDEFLERPAYMSYRGNRVYMDSFVANVPWFKASRSDQERRHRAQNAWVDDATRRKCIAAVAVQSRRKKVKRAA